MYIKTNIEKMLAPSVIALREAGIVKFVSNDSNIQKKDVFNEYDGYIAGFGATVVNMGIKAALAFYMKDFEDLEKAEVKNKDNEKAYRAKVVKAFANMLGKSSAKVLFEEVLAENSLNKLYQHTQKVVDASVALKLVIRTYKFVDKSKNND